MIINHLKIVVFIKNELYIFLLLIISDIQMLIFVFTKYTLLDNKVNYFHFDAYFNNKKALRIPILFTL
jgi:hypothetical protein